MEIIKAYDKRFQWVEKHGELKSSHQVLFFQLQQWMKRVRKKRFHCVRFNGPLSVLMCYVQTLLCVIHLLQRLTCFRCGMTKTEAWTEVSFLSAGKNLFLSSGETWWIEGWRWKFERGVLWGFPLEEGFCCSCNGIIDEIMAFLNGEIKTWWK